MGFKCPVCFKDFKTNKREWEEHCKKEHSGLGEYAVKLLKKIAEKPTK